VPAAVAAAAHAALSALHVGSADGLTHATVSILDAAHLPALALEQAVTDAYQALAGVMAQAGCHPVRFWNFIPGIHAAMDVDADAAAAHPRDRYMVFNAGRFAAFASTYGSPAAFSRSLPTASAVGVREGPLVIHALGLESPGAPLENPRQVPAYSYSRRYGPLPPCFARATLVQAPREERPWLLVGGTASILGEDSIHMRDPRRQAVETFENLARLVESGRSSAGSADRGDPLAAFRELRVYIVREQDADLLRAMVEERFPAGTRVEYAQADLCRQELLVEIEGLATL
jgi:chorismate lyase/3-hydroxybenzoate synthase